MTTLTSAAVCGTWKLESFEIECPDKRVSPWGRDTHGLLIYADTGHMSVSINKAIENDPEQNETQNLFDAVLFYSGTWKLEGNTISHHVENASNPSRIGKEMIRYGQLDGDVLLLATPQESFGRAIIKWRKFKR